MTLCWTNVSLRLFMWKWEWNVAFVSSNKTDLASRVLLPYWTTHVLQCDYYACVYDISAETIHCTVVPMSMSGSVRVSHGSEEHITPCNGVALVCYGLYVYNIDLYRRTRYHAKMAPILTNEKCSPKIVFWLQRLPHGFIDYVSFSAQPTDFTLWWCHRFLNHLTEVLQI